MSTANRTRNRHGRRFPLGIVWMVSSANGHALLAIVSYQLLKSLDRRLDYLWSPRLYR